MTVRIYTIYTIFQFLIAQIMKNDIEKLDKNIILVCIDPISPITSAWRISKNQ